MTAAKMSSAPTVAESDSLQGHVDFIRDWSLIMGRGGGACEVLPLREGGGGGTNSFRHAEGGTISCEIVFT